MKFVCQCSFIDPAHFLEVAPVAEEYGFDTIGLSDHVVNPDVIEAKYPYNEDGSRQFLDDVPFLEPFVAVPALAAVTERIDFSTSVVKLPIRNPVLVAKQLATIAVMSTNRFVFGVGLSPWKEDFDICGERWRMRGKRMDEMIEIIRRLLAGGYFGGRVSANSRPLRSHLARVLSPRSPSSATMSHPFMGLPVMSKGRTCFLPSCAAAPSPRRTIRKSL